MDYKCPSCGKMVFNRRLENCEFCNAPLPKEIVYTPEERERIDREIRDEIVKNREDEGILAGLVSAGGDAGRGAARPEKEYNCPNCGRTIHNRRLKNCEFCDAVLPDELLYSEEEWLKGNREIRDVFRKHEDEQRRIREGEKKKKITEDDVKKALERLGI